MSSPGRELYERQVREAAALVARAAGIAEHDVVWQSRSGSPSVPWLEPDICDHLRLLAASGSTDIVLCPLGFVSDHMEVVWDLDHEAADLARELGLRLERAATPGPDPRFAQMVVDLAQTAADDQRPSCQPGCCSRPGEALS